MVPLYSATASRTYHWNKKSFKHEPIRKHFKKKLALLAEATVKGGGEVDPLSAKKSYQNKNNS